MGPNCLNPLKYKIILVQIKKTATASKKSNLKLSFLISLSALIMNVSPKLMPIMSSFSHSFSSNSSYPRRLRLKYRIKRVIHRPKSMK